MYAARVEKVLARAHRRPPAERRVDREGEHGPVERVDVLERVPGLHQDDVPGVGRGLPGARVEEHRGRRDGVVRLPAAEPHLFRVRLVPEADRFAHSAIAFEPRGRRAATAPEGTRNPGRRKSSGGRGPHRDRGRSQRPCGVGVGSAPLAAMQQPPGGPPGGGYPPPGGGGYGPPPGGGGWVLRRAAGDLPPAAGMVRLPETSGRLRAATAADRPPAATAAGHPPGASADRPGEAILRWRPCRPRPRRAGATSR